MSKRDKGKQRGPLTPKKKHVSDQDADVSGFGEMPTDQFFGYTKVVEDVPSALGGDSKPVCMATQVKESDLPRLYGMTVTAGQWVVSRGGCESPEGTKLHGPFKTMEEAFEYGHQTFKVISWRPF